MRPASCRTNSPYVRFRVTSDARDRTAAERPRSPFCFPTLSLPCPNCRLLGIGIMPLTCLLTGATGFVGSHLAEACVARGYQLRALVRAGSDTRLLEKLGVALHGGDLTDVAAVRKAVEGVEAVVHCAAKVGDWGPVEE